MPSLIASTLFLAALGAVLGPVLGFSHGAPGYSCKNLIPGHEGIMTSPPPYSVQVSSDVIPPGGSIRVALTSTQDIPFRGFLCAVSRLDDDMNNTVGQMALVPGSSSAEELLLLTCTRSTPDTGITHKSKVDKMVSEFDWRAPVDASAGQMYKLRCTLVQTYSRVWTDLQVNLRVATGAVTSTDSSSSTGTVGSGVNNNNNNMGSNTRGNNGAGLSVSGVNPTVQGTVGGSGISVSDLFSSVPPQPANPIPGSRPVSSLTPLTTQAPAFELAFNSAPVPGTPSTNAPSLNVNRNGNGNGIGGQFFRPTFGQRGSFLLPNSNGNIFFRNDRNRNMFQNINDVRLSNSNPAANQIRNRLPPVRSASRNGIGANRGTRRNFRRRNNNNNRTVRPTTVDPFFDMSVMDNQPMMNQNGFAEGNNLIMADNQNVDNLSLSQLLLLLEGVQRIQAADTNFNEGNNNVLFRGGDRRFNEQNFNRNFQEF